MTRETTPDTGEFPIVGQYAGSRLYLMMSREEASARVIELGEGQECTFGRSEDCTIFIDDSRVSRRQTKIRRENGQVIVEDLGSRNGTKLNGETLRSESRPAKGGDVIRMG